MNKKEEFPTKIVTYEAQETLLKIATEKNDFDLLGAIKDVDLIASEFKKHKSSYKSYTRSAKNNSEPSKLFATLLKMKLFLKVNHFLLMRC